MIIVVKLQFTAGPGPYSNRGERASPPGPGGSAAGSTDALGGKQCRLLYLELKSAVGRCCCQRIVCCLRRTSRLSYGPPLESPGAQNTTSPRGSKPGGKKGLNRLECHTWTMMSFLSLGLPSGHSSPKHRLISKPGRLGVWPRWWAITAAQHTRIQASKTDRKQAHRQTTDNYLPLRKDSKQNSLTFFWRSIRFGAVWLGAQGPDQYTLHWQRRTA